MLRGKSLNKITLESGLDALLVQAQFRTSARRASADYRQHIVIGLFKDTLESAWERAEEKTTETRRHRDFSIGPSRKDGVVQRNFRVLKNKYAIPLLEKELTDKIIGAAIEVHKVLGPGLLESSQRVCLEHESMLRKIPFEHKVKLPVNFKGIDLDAGYETDLIKGKGAKN